MTKHFLPKQSYIEIVKVKSNKLNAPLKNQLLILDLNGTLVSRVRKRSMYVRPYSGEFFDYIFDNFKVMVWSSAQPSSVYNMCRMFKERKSEISVIWDRTSFGLTDKDYYSKVLTIKDLDIIWKHHNNQYDATNTILLDDSSKKAQLQPFNCIHPTEFVHHSEQFISNGESELLNLMSYLKVLQFQSNVANYIQNNPYDKLPKDTSKNSCQVEFYAFSDDYKSPPELIDCREKKKKECKAEHEAIVNKLLKLGVS
ncbi:MAG: HAD-like domain-containing protein [Benjaminiella poitrasii]|nr:MAG: HAD-like domain-containing protein [Benjaminiella poitrasii]